jgi:glucarate dehydratase
MDSSLTIRIRDDRPVSRIAKVEAWPVNVPLEAPYDMAPGIVAGIHRTIVRVTTSDGIVGLGETPSPADATSLGCDLGPTFVGRDTSEALAALGRREPQPAEHRSDSKVLIDNPLAGIEIALWDIKAREDGVPLYELLGPTCRSEVAFTEYFAYREGREQRPADVAAYCTRMIEEHDSPAFEGKVGVRSADDDVRLAREVRAAIGDRTLRLDANMGWTLETARSILSSVEPLDIANVEEPVGSFEEMADLRRSTAIPFSSHVPDAARAEELGAPDAIVIGLAFFGGIAGTRRFVAECEQAGIRFWFYSGDLGVATAAYLHVAAATPYLELPSQSLLRWTTDDVIADGPFKPEAGVVLVPTGPGLGVELDEKALARCVERFAREGAYDFYSGPSLPRY